MTEQVYAVRGEVATRADQPHPEVTTRVRVSLFWLGRHPLVGRKEYVLKLGAARVPARLEAIHRTLDAATLEESSGAAAVERHQVAECSLALSRPIAFDLASNLGPTGRFVIVDDNEICGGGIVREALPDRQAWVRDKVLRRNSQWAPSHISEERRIERYSQRPVLLLVTGAATTDRKGLAREFEARLFEEGRLVYFLGMGNLVYGVDADIDRSQESRPEHLRRLGEVANILLDAGMIVIAAAASLTREEVEVVGTAVGQDRVSTVWLGDLVGTDLVPDLSLAPDDGEDRLGRMKTLLQDQGVIFRNRP
jgi:bifunctional enzyme CysN/CysC